MEVKNLNKRIEQWKIEETKPFKGWDFSYLAARAEVEKPPWSYDEMVKELLATSHSLLDLGTGGGERLMRYKDVLPREAFATESYPPNLRLAKERLEPLGIRVIEANDGLENQLPFAEEIFDLVIDRHTAFNISEVERILAPGGIFLTEQRDGNSYSDLTEVFDGKPPWPFYNLKFVLEKIKTTDLKVEMSQEWTGKTIFKDVGAIVYYIKAVPWTVPGFSVEKQQENLIELQKQLEEGRELLFHHKLFLVRARKV